MEHFITQLLRLRNRHFLAIDLLIFLVTPTVALTLRTDEIGFTPAYLRQLFVVTLVFLAVKLAVFMTGRLYSRFWRYASLDELAHIALLGLLALCIQTLVYFWVMRPAMWLDSDFPRSLPIIEGVLALLAVGAVRYSVPLAERYRDQRISKREGERVIVVGAGKAGVMIVQEMQSNPQLGMRAVAFVDDSNVKQGMRIRGVPVMGKCANVARVAREMSAKRVIIAMPAASGKAIREVVSESEHAGLQTKIIPGMYELLDGTATVKQLRDVRIEDLLRREPVRTDITAVSELLRGKRVLITGGGGSIGSELCRQVLRFDPESLVILGHGENSVFEIYNELTRLLAKGLVSMNRDGEQRVVSTKIYSVIADVRSAERMQAVFEEHRPEVVFHSAAHKHVPLMEMNPAEAITNNILGTRNTLDASLAVGVEHFVMISTDKAVNPTSIMGASKRVAELLVHRAAQRSGKSYVAVRFGNVLGSRGSVVLTFRQQIASGGPVTVTHPDMVRYFMTIPEAVQLVLQAAPLGHEGEVFMLDMGEPVKIVDLAKDLIELSGLEVGRDIDIVFQGVRPGEKLYEELFIAGESYERTRHEKIFLATTASGSVPAFLDDAVMTLSMAAERNDNAAIRAGLQHLIAEYRPESQGKDQGGNLEPLKMLAPGRVHSRNGTNGTNGASAGSHKSTVAGPKRENHYSHAGRDVVGDGEMGSIQSSAS
ncbi:MAG: polysaccharide biosynthesis protein [Chloroflexia bacterium]